ncbi:MAG: type II secretion system protein [Verrucomicrobiales bacterium]|nr:type II secretion system protein [Verrucomicrobiales bacterium]
MKLNQATQRAFTLIELLIVITIIGILASTAMPAYNGIQERGKRIKSVSNVKNITLACRSFSADWEGLYPSFDPDADTSGAGGGEDSDFSTSTDAFNVLIPDYIDTESIFWTQTRHPDKLRPPREDGQLENEENVYLYVVNQTDTSFSRSPLVADGLMDGIGSYGQYHPWLRSKKAIVGYCGGHVSEEKLTSNQPGATVRSRDGMTDNIFSERQTSDDGGSSGGYLDTSPDNVLLPN